MVDLRSLATEDHVELTGLFEGHRRRRDGLDAMLEGRLGEAVCSRDGSVARLSYSDLSFYGGDFDSDAARALIKSWDGGMTPENDTWESLMLEVKGEGCERRLRRDHDPADFNVDHLQSIIASLPTGYEIKQLDLSLARKLIADIHPAFINNFDSVESFAADGVGFGVLYEGAFVSGVTSSVVARRSLGPQIISMPEHRSKNLATTVSAALILWCLEADLAVYWSASTDASFRVAQKLGYVDPDIYEEIKGQKEGGVED